MVSILPFLDYCYASPYVLTIGNVFIQRSAQPHINAKKLLDNKGTWQRDTFLRLLPLRTLTETIKASIKYLLNAYRYSNLNTRKPFHQSNSTVWLIKRNSPIVTISTIFVVKNDSRRKRHGKLQLPDNLLYKIVHNSSNCWSSLALKYRISGLGDFFLILMRRGDK